MINSSVDTSLTMKRIQNARRAMTRAQNPQFQAYWFNVAQKLTQSLN